MARSKWLLLLLIPLLTGFFDTRGPFRTRGPLKVSDFTVGGGSTCIDGVNCFCDLQASNPNNLFCEDFESVDYYEETANSWVSTAGGVRGYGSRWFLNYSYTGASWYAAGTPASPKIGVSCSNGGGVCGLKEYCSAAQGALTSAGVADCWDGNSGAAIDIQRTDDYKAEIASLTLSGGWGVTSDIGDGRQHMAYRNTPGDTKGIIGNVTFASSTDVGVIMLLAYSSNLTTSGILARQWKHDEWGDDFQHWNLGNYDSTTGSRLPYRPWLWTTTQGACNTARAAATFQSGTVSGCFDNPSLYYAASSTAYNQGTDFPYGTWGCHRAHIRGLGTSNVRVTIWHNDVQVFDMSGFDGAALRETALDQFAWNNYSNAAGQGLQTQTAYRYQDNVMVTAGAPPTCASLGFQ